MIYATQYRLEKMKTYAKKIILFSIIAGMFFFIRVSDLSHYLTFENLQKNKEALHAYVEGHYAFSVILYISMYVTSTAFSIPGATILTLAGGFLFGALLCAVYVNVGATTGAIMAFLSAKYLIGAWVQNRYRRQLTRFNEEIASNGHLYLLTLRFVPVFPFFLLNVLAGLTNIPLKTFLWTTALGIIPGSLVYAFAGSQLNTIKSAGDIFSWRMAAAFILLALFSLLPVLINKSRNKAHET